MPTKTVHFKVRGQIAELWQVARPAVLIEGAAGSGKTYPICNFIHQFCSQKPGLRVLMLRKTLISLTDTVLVTMRDEVLELRTNPVYPMVYKDLQGERRGSVHWFGGSKEKPAAFEYDNGSTIIVGGMDNSTKFMSGMYDIIYVCEAVELTEGQVDDLRSRLRGNTLNRPRLVMDTNPSYVTHWLNTACEMGRIHRIRTYPQDNPLYYNDDGSFTKKGEEYTTNQLQLLQGSRRQRLYLGEWVGVENAIYPHFDIALHVRPLDPGLRFIDGAEGVDYGRRHLCGAASISMDQYGRRWVREVWGEPADDHGAQLISQVRRQMKSYAIRRGMTDPLQDVLAGNLGIEIADGSPGSRIHRTDLVGRLLNVYPQGTSVVGLDEESNPFKRKLEPLPYDSPGLLFVEGAPGIDALCEQMFSYQEVAIVSNTRDDWQVARKNDDYIAAMEYATERLEEPPAHWPSSFTTGKPRTEPVILAPTEGVQKAPARTWGELFGKRRKDKGSTMGART